MKYTILILCIITFSGCKQISGSVEATFHPADSVVNKEKPSDEYTSDTITIHTSISISSYEHIESKSSDKPDSVYR